MKHLPKIKCKVINHKDQRYETAGDYFENRGANFRISKMERPEYELAVLVHELVEYFLITRDKIKIKDIDKFDTELVEDYYKHDPGMSPNAPYHIQHKKAVLAEKLVIRLLGGDWKLYNYSFNKLKWKK